MHPSNVFAWLLVLGCGWWLTARYLPAWRWTKMLFAALTIACWLLIYPFTNNLIGAWWEYQPVRPQCANESPQIIIILPAGLRHHREITKTSLVRLTRGLAFAIDYPESALLIPASDREVDSIENELGRLRMVARERVTLLRGASNTDKSAITLASHLDQAEQKGNIWLVTSALHMKRALMAFEHQGLLVCPVAIDHTSDRSAMPWWIIPAPLTFERSNRLFHELLGTAVYWLRYQLS